MIMVHVVPSRFFSPVPGAAGATATTTMASWRGGAAAMGVLALLLAAAGDAVARAVPAGGVELGSAAAAAAVAAAAAAIVLLFYTSLCSFCPRKRRTGQPAHGVGSKGTRQRKKLNRNAPHRSASVSSLLSDDEDRYLLGGAASKADAGKPGSPTRKKSSEGFFSQAILPPKVKTMIDFIKGQVKHLVEQVR